MYLCQISLNIFLMVPILDGGLQGSVFQLD